jgi:putative addiction module component (TIGR02574 family)
MSKTDILQELPKLKPEERREVLERIWQIDEEAILSERPLPTDEEKALLDGELADYQKDPRAGSDWETVESRLPNSSEE